MIRLLTVSNWLLGSTESFLMVLLKTVLLRLTGSCRPAMIAGSSSRQPNCLMVRFDEKPRFGGVFFALCEGGGN